VQVFERPRVIECIHLKNGGKDDGSNFRLVCMGIGLLGGRLRHNLQGNQRLGVCDHLADPDGHHDRDHRQTMAKDSSTHTHKLNKRTPVTSNGRSLYLLDHNGIHDLLKDRLIGFIDAAINIAPTFTFVDFHIDRLSENR
jgi:hypothetical protein